MIAAYALLAFVLFLVYWVVGGAFFAVFSFMRQAKYRRAQFGCLYTISAGLTSIAAAYSTSLVEQKQIQSCLSNSSDIFDELAALFGCGVFGLTLMTLLWLLVTAMIGGMILFFSRSRNQSWMDDDHIDEAELEVSFDTL